VEYKIIKEVLLDSKEPTGKTTHIIRGVQMPTPSKLQIAQYANDTGFYLFYLDDKDVVMTDTYHETKEGAEDQANWEYGVSLNEWNCVTN